MNLLPPQLRFAHRSHTTPATNGQPPQLAPAGRARGRSRSPAAFARRLAQPLPLIGIALLVVSAVGYIAVAARSQTHSSEVVVAAHNLPAGTRLTTSDLRLVKLSAGQELLAQLVPSSDETALVGRRLAAPAFGGLPVARESVAQPGGGPAAFTLTVAALHALGGNLAIGDRVSVLATFTSPSGAATARVIARHLVVLAVGQPPTGIDQSSATVAVTVALPDPGVASELALANTVGKIDLLRDGSNAAAVIPSATTSSNGLAP
jgi:Flp pilus assembly protein CpaB